jgi:outer membrane protein OmpA-like peptidoglycan-associated protein
MLRLMKTKCSQFFIVPVRVACNETWGNLLVLLVLLFISGCATANDKVVLIQNADGTIKDTVVLVQDADGKVGQLTVTTRGGTKTLTAANTMVEVTGSGESPSDPKKIDQSQIDSLFTDSINALPLPPVSFLLYFLNNSTELTAESKSYIPKIVSLVNKKGFYEISIVGHTDTTGNDEYNMRLSSARAEAVRDALLSHGIRFGQMELSYYGKRDPVVPTGDNVREPRNRRVEVVVK